MWNLCLMACIFNFKHYTSAFQNLSRSASEHYNDDPERQASVPLWM